MTRAQAAIAFWFSTYTIVLGGFAKASNDGGLIYVVVLSVVVAFITGLAWLKKADCLP